MERDFLGLKSKDSVIVVKEETVEGCKDSGVPWTLSNKVSALPHFMSFKTAQEDRTVKIMSDPLVSGFMALSTADAFDDAHKRSSGEMQKNFNHDRQGGTHFSITAYPVQQNAHPVHLPHDAHPVLPLKQQLLGGIPVTTSHPVLPSIGSVAGINEPWFNSKSSAAPAQLTIFYGGTVNVYDDISPEKAQAIMFLAGNGSSAASNTTQPRAQVQTLNSKLAAVDGVFVNQPMNTPPCSALSSPMSVSSHPVGQSGSGSISNDEVMAAKTTGVSTAPVSKVDPPKIVTSLGPVSATNMIPSAVPQARKASLARFLEKRKERVMNSAPYNLNKKSPECGSPGSMNDL
ncbi:hypothetical protein F0562_033492 [Nyssa sinensis]|uniref:Protein TIFY n=1 Tax=Nyssa sinensis TaxID=561372 RepID=A0A5J5AEN3_9ASTE|nr:hypothetical protein F0562_033492 [Nyssa sinensis]